VCFGETDHPVSQVLLLQQDEDDKNDDDAGRIRLPSSPYTANHAKTARGSRRSILNSVELDAFRGGVSSLHWWARLRLWTEEREAPLRS
jgi:hypothetical protein